MFIESFFGLIFSLSSTIQRYNLSKNIRFFTCRRRGYSLLSIRSAVFGPLLFTGNGAWM